MDTDASGLIHYGIITRYFELAEQGLYRLLFNGWNVNDLPCLLPRVHCEYDLKETLKYGDYIEISATIEKLGTASVHFRYSITRLSDAVECITGRIVAVAFDGERSVPLPQQLIDAIT